MQLQHYLRINYATLLYKMSGFLKALEDHLPTGLDDKLEKEFKNYVERQRQKSQSLKNCHWRTMS